MKSIIFIFFGLIILSNTIFGGDLGMDEEIASTIIQSTNFKEENIKNNKFIIYQMFPRLFSNIKTINRKNGSMEENGVGKLNDINDKALRELKKLGANYIWYTGIIEHATMTDYLKYGIQQDNPNVVKGRAGSPYAIKDYYDVDPDLAVDVKNRMAEFEKLVSRTHSNNLKVIIDFIPNHLARGYTSDNMPKGTKAFGENDDVSKEFSAQNNFYYIKDSEFHVPDSYKPLGGEDVANKDKKFVEKPAKATGNDVFSDSPSTDDWFETVKLNYGIDIKNNREKHFSPIPDTWNKMRDILLFWAGKGVDGFRCDMVEMVPYEFWGWVIPQIKAVNKKIIFIGEIYNTGEYARYINEGKFDFLYDKVGMYDRVRLLMQGRGDVDEIFSVIKDQNGISSNMLKFLENHDEQRIASRQFSGNMWTAVPGMTLSATISTAPVMIYFAQESGEQGKGSEGFAGDDGRTTIFDYWGVTEHQKWVNNGLYDGGGLSPDQLKLRAFYTKLLNLIQEKNAFKNGEFYDLSYANKRGQSEGWSDTKIYPYFRWTKESKILIILNFEKKKTIETFLKIPDEAFETIGLDKSKTYKCKELLWGENLLELKSINLSERIKPNAGIPIKLPPMSAFIYELE